jgi:hypothetical protein
MNSNTLQAWSDLRLSGQGDGLHEIPTRPSVVETGYGPVLFALGQNSEPRVLVPYSGRAKSKPIESTAKLVVHYSKYRFGDSYADFIDLQCTDLMLEKVFGEMVDEILRRIQDGNSPDDSANGTVSEFKSLLMESEKNEPSLQELIGMIGELHVVCLLAKHSLDCMRAWTGPWDSRHDFRRSTQAVEVKTSSRSDTSRVHIHGVDQLLPPSGGKLTLVHINMEESAAGVLSVGAVFRHLVEKGVDVERLREGLACYGCKDPESAEWNSRKFELQSIKFWKVAEGFPRIADTEFSGGITPTGISDVSYVLETTHAEKFRISVDEFDDFLKEMFN